MKNLDYYIDSAIYLDESSHHIKLFENGLDGGKISKKTIDIIKTKPQASEIIISGLTQDTFDYFIDQYGHQFLAINFWKCPLVKNFKKIEQLTNIQYITYYWNQRAETLWDFSKTKALKGFSFRDFTRLHHVTDLSTAKNLEELDFGSKIYNTYVLQSLEPIANCKKLHRLTFSAKKIIDNSINAVSHLSSLAYLTFPDNLFTTEQIAWLKSKCPKLNIPENGIAEIIFTLKEDKAIHIFQPLEKRKPKLYANTIEKDRKKLEKYISEFKNMIIWFKANLEALPDDYQQRKQ